MNVSLPVSLASAEVDAKCYDAFNCGRQKDALRLLNQVKDPHTVKSDKNITLLHYAACYGWLNVVKELINEHQFNPYCEDDDGNTPLSTAKSNGKQPVVEYLETFIGTFFVYFFMTLNSMFVSINP